MIAVGAIPKSRSCSSNCDADVRNYRTIGPDHRTGPSDRTVAPSSLRPLGPLVQLPSNQRKNPINDCIDRHVGGIDVHRTRCERKR